MIRREDTPPDGPPRWLLISQIEHARLSAELAAHWGNPPLAAVEPRDVVLPTIRRHDDGWRDWEARPAVDAEGTPVSFMEMPAEEGNEIWQKSIEGIADLGPLAQYLVASHFVERRRQSPHASPERTAFVTEFERRCEHWLAQWQRQAPGRNTVELAEMALLQLQFFDALSLWFCCQPPTAPHNVTAPARVPLTFTPLSADRVQVSPWPLTQAALTLQVKARSVPRRPYASAGELAAVSPETETLCWHVSPGP